MISTKIGQYAKIARAANHAGLRCSSQKYTDAAVMWAATIAAQMASATLAASPSVTASHAAPIGLEGAFSLVIVCAAFPHCPLVSPTESARKG